MLGHCGCGASRNRSGSIFTHLLTVLRDVNKVLVQPQAGIMPMFDGGPDVGLGVGQRIRGIRFAKQGTSDEDIRCATPGEEFQYYYRLTPGSKIKIGDIVNWARMNGYYKSLGEIITTLENNGMSIIPTD